MLGRGTENECADRPKKEGRGGKILHFRKKGGGSSGKAKITSVDKGTPSQAGQ